MDDQGGSDSQGRVVYTIGHSNRSLEEFIAILRHYHIEAIIDVRRWPKSRRNPQFNRENLSAELASKGIRYIWMGDRLGGYVKPSREDLNPKCFKSPGFNAYARYITTSPEARSALEEVENIASRMRSAIMCAEHIPWRCHRKLISDWLVARGFIVLHIVDTGKIVRHELTKCARIVGRELSYIL